MSNTPPNVPNVPNTPTPPATSRPSATPVRDVPVENAPTTVAGSGKDSAPLSAPQSASADQVSTTNADDAKVTDGNDGSGSASNTDEPKELSQPEDSDGKSLSDVARRAAEGEFGRGQAMRKNLKAAGWDFRVVQDEMVRLRNQQ